MTTAQSAYVFTVPHNRIAVLCNRHCVVEHGPYVVRNFIGDHIDTLRQHLRVLKKRTPTKKRTSTTKGTHNVQEANPG